jgi:hypothetical protein
MNLMKISFHSEFLFCSVSSSFSGHFTVKICQFPYWYHETFSVFSPVLKQVLVLNSTSRSKGIF